MHRSLLGFSLCSGIPNCWRKKALRARAGLSQRTASSVCGSRWIRTIFSLIHRQECGSGQCVHLRAVCPRHLLNIRGLTWEEPWLYLSTPSPWRLFRLQLQKQNEAKLCSGVSSRHRRRGHCLCPHLLLRIHPWESATAAARVRSLVKNPATSGTTGYICTRKQSRVRVRYWLWPLTVHTIAFWAWWLAWFRPMTASPPATQQLGRA